MHPTKSTFNIMVHNMGIVKFMYILCLGCVLVSSQVYPTDFRPPPNTDDGIDPFEQLLQEMPFKEMVQAFADVLNQNTIKESLNEACTHARRIMDVVTSPVNGPTEIKDPVYPAGIKNPLFPAEINGSHTGKFPNHQSSVDTSPDVSLDSFCAPIEQAATSGGDVDLYKEICTLLELSSSSHYSENIDYTGDYNVEEHNDHPYPGPFCQGDFIEVPGGYKWLFDSLLLLTFDTSWSSPWRFYMTSPRELVDAAFKQDWESGDMNCGLLSVKLGELSGKQFIDQAMRRVFYEKLRDEYHYKTCGQYSDRIEEGLDKDEAFKRNLIDQMQAYLFTDNCTLLDSVFYSGNTAPLKDILDSAISNYYSIITDNTQCNQFLQSVIGSNLDPTVVILNYTGYGGSIGGLCSALTNAYTEYSQLEDAGNLNDRQRPPIEGLYQYGGYSKNCDGSYPYQSYLSLASLFLDDRPALIVLSEYCKAFNDLHGEDKDLCDGLKEANELNSWGPFSTTCEKYILERYDHEAWKQKFHGNQAFSIIFSSFFLFTFNGDWDMPYRHDFVAITKFIRQSFDLWQNYDTVCQNVGDSLNEKGSVLASNAIKTTFRNYIRDRLSVSCNQITTTTTPFLGDIFEENSPNFLDDPEKQAETVLIPMFQFLLSFQTKEEMCATFPKTMDEIEIAADLATTSFLSLLVEESKCQDFLNTYGNGPSFPGFHDALRRFTGYGSIQEFCGYLVEAFGVPTEEIQADNFENKIIKDPYDVYLDNGYVFDSVHYKDLIPVAAHLYKSPTLRDGLILLCDNFKNSLDLYRMDSDICESLKSEEQNFQAQCQMSKWLTEDFGPERKRYMFPWLEFERWLPDWFYDYSGFDHIFYMYFDWSLSEPIALDLSQVLSDIIGFPIPDTYGTCNRLADIFREQEMIGDIIDRVLERTLDHLSSMAPTLCLADHLPFPKDAYAAFDEFEVPPTPNTWAYDETYWKHVHIGPIEGPLVGKIFAYLAGYDPVSTMCPLLSSVKSVYPEMLKTRAMENLSKIRTHEGYCKLFVEFVDEERRQAYKDVPSLAEKTGFTSTQSMCNVLVAAFNNPNQELQFSWSNVTKHFRYYQPDEWIPQSPGEMLPSATYHQMAQLIGSIYNHTNLRSGVDKICRVLDIQTYANDFPFENELCTLARDPNHDSNFREYCQKEGSQYDTYNISPGFPEPPVDFYYEEVEWHPPRELLVLYEFARGQFGLDITNAWSICEVAGDLLTTSITDLVDEIKMGMSMVIKSFLRYRHDLYCYNTTEDIHKSDDFPLEILAEALSILADYDTSDQFCSNVKQLLQEDKENANNKYEEGRCARNPGDAALDSSLDTIATKIISSALMIIEDHKACSEFIAIFYTHFGEYIAPVTGYDTAGQLCTVLVNAFSSPKADTLYNPPVIPANVADLFEDFEPFQEAGQILPFLTIDQAIEFVGYLYNKPTPEAILAYLCENYKSTLDSFDMEELDPLKQSCEVIKDGNIVKFCEEQLIPLLYGAGYPIGLRQVNITFELQRIILSLAGGEMVMSNQGIISAIETIINSQMSFRDVANNVMDELLPKLIRATSGICRHWDTVINYLKGSSDGDKPSPDIGQDRHDEGGVQLVKTAFDFAGILSGYSTREGHFDCNRLLAEDPIIIAEMLKRKMWCYTKNVEQCVVAIDAMMDFVNTLSGEAVLTEDLLPELIGYSNTLEMCQAFVDLISAPVCAEEYHPLCGTDGVTYNNKCLFETKQCEDPTLELQNTGDCGGDCNTICTEEYSPLCGTDGVTYSNKCHFDIAQCRDRLLELRTTGKCRDCDMICTREYKPVCGTDGETYSNKCIFGIAQCEDPTLEIRNTGECDGVPGVCLTFIDCAGDCGGSAQEDCYGMCKGVAVKDCSGKCDGTAVTNDCGYCVGGNTGRALDFGRDICGECVSRSPTYQLIVDCAGVCGGTAFYDACKECVGGTSGKAADKNDEFIDCAGTCNGDWQKDSCEYCGPPYKGLYGSVFKDCTGTCHEPGYLAWVNECEECVGGSTGNAANHGINQCGICGQDETKCTGCDGIVKSGKIEDACGECDGDGTSCTTVSAIQPLIVPSAEGIQFEIHGAGFTNLQGAIRCIFQPNVHGSRVEVVGTPTGPQMLTCQLENNVRLTPDVYDVTIQAGDIPVQGESLKVAAYDAGLDLTMNPTEANLDVESITVSFTGSDNLDFESIKSLFSDVSSAANLLVLDVQQSNGENKSFPGIVSESAYDEISFDVSGFPPHSMQVQMLPRFGNNYLPSTPEQGFNFTFLASPSQLVGLEFDSSGARILASFKPGVVYSKLMTCDDIFADITALGDSPKCKWISPEQLSVTIGKGNSNQLIGVGDSLTLKPGALSTLGEEFSYPVTGSRTVSLPSNPVLPVAVIQGHTEISSCGTVQLSARGSTGGGGREMNYQWSVCNGTGNLDLIRDISTDPRVITIEGTDLQANQDYGLCLALTNFLSRRDDEEITVRRSSEDRPEASIIPHNIDINNAFVSERFVLQADVKFTECFPPSDVIYRWSVDRGDVALNLKTRLTPALLVERNTLPGDSTIVFTLRVSKASDITNFVERSTTIMTKYSDLLPVINKPYEFTIGRLSKDLVLDASRSIDPDNVAVQTFYRWKCLQVTNQTACFIKGGDRTTFPNPEYIERDVVVLDPLQMFAGVSYMLTVEISKGSRWASTSVLVHVVDGDPPEVIITTDTKSKRRVDKLLQLDAVIRSPKVDVDRITWMALMREGYGYVDITDVNSQPTRLFGDGYTSTLRIEPGTLSPGVDYVFQLSACVSDVCSDAVVEIHTLPIVTSCVLSIEGGNTYTALNLITASIDNCVTSTSAYPLTYQLYRALDSGGNREAITEKQTISTFETIGKHARTGTSENIFLAKVCNIYGVCSWFEMTATVLPSELTAEQKAQLKELLVETEKNKQQFLDALVNLNVIEGQNIINRRKRRNAPVPVLGLEQLELVKNVVEVNVLDAASVQLLIDQFSAINLNDLTYSDRGDLLDAVCDILDVFEAGTPIPPTYVKIILDIIGKIGKDLIPEQQQKLREINSRLASSRLTELTLGAEILESISDQVTSIVQRVIPKGIFRSKSGSNAASIDFGAEIEQRFGHIWSCSSGDTCSGVVIQYEHFDTAADYFSKTTEDRNFRAADIISIAFRDPESDAEIAATGLATLITINMTITRPQSDKIYQCRYWSDNDEEWKSDGLETVIQSDLLVSCLTSHLTQFTVIGVDPENTPTTDEKTVTTLGPKTPAPQTPAPKNKRSGSNTVLIVIIVVVVLLIIVIVLMVVIIICVKKSHSKIVPANNEPLITHNQEYGKPLPTAPPLAVISSGVVPPSAPLPTALYSSDPPMYSPPPAVVHPTVDQSDAPPPYPSVYPELDKPTMSPNCGRPPSRGDAGLTDIST